MRSERVEAAKAALVADMEEVALGAGVAGLIIGKPLPLVVVARSVGRMRPRAHVYAGLAETEDGGWDATIFLRESMLMNVESIRGTVSIR